MNNRQFGFGPSGQADSKRAREITVNTWSKPTSQPVSQPTSHKPDGLQMQVNSLMGTAVTALLAGNTSLADAAVSQIAELLADKPDQVQGLSREL